MKAILVIDMPDGINVNDVIIGGDGNIYFMREGWKELIVGNIKNIKPMPRKLPEVYCDSMWGWNKILDRMIEEQIKIEDFAKGWNACIEEIEK